MSRTRARELARQHLANNDPKGWFEALYAEAHGDKNGVPWADMSVNPHLAQWLDTHSISGQSKTALVIGCGLGDDAEELAKRGFQVTAFDISPEAIRWAKKRFAASNVNYVATDLLAAPESWHNSFDLVIEIYTLQVLPPELRPSAMTAMAKFVCPNGVLLVVARGRDETDDKGTMPWPLTCAELEVFSAQGLKLIRFEDYMDEETPSVRRFRVEFIRPTMLGNHILDKTLN